MHLEGDRESQGLTRGRIALPERIRSPWWELSRRLLAALFILVGTVLLVWFDKEGYRDGNDPPLYAVSFTDAISRGWPKNFLASDVENPASSTASK